MEVLDTKGKKLDKKDVAKLLKEETVALASMLCKYLREVCMRQFNRFWEKHVPGIEPTAGYPVDAKRFYEAIQAAMERSKELAEGDA